MNANATTYPADSKFADDAPDLRETLQEIVKISAEYFTSDIIYGRAEMVGEINLLARSLLSHLGEPTS